MLIARHADRTDPNARVAAYEADRKALYVCPGCGQRVVLKRGSKVVAHFAHKLSRECSGSRGETLAHLRAKQQLADALTARGLKADVEVTLGGAPWERRADVCVWHPKTEQPIAIEFQRAGVGPKDLAERAEAYAHQGVAQMWIAFLEKGVWDSAERLEDGSWLAKRYAPPQHEMWARGFNQFAPMFLIDAFTGKYWRTQIEDHQLRVKETVFREYGVDPTYKPAHEKRSIRYRDLRLEGSYDVEQLRIGIAHRRAEASEYYRWPAGVVARFVL